MTRGPEGSGTAPHAKHARVQDARGHAGRVVGDLDDGVVVRLDDGRQVLLPAEALRAERDGSYTVAFDLDPDDPVPAVPRERPAAAAAAAPPPRDAAVRDSGAIPVLSEELVVERRAHVTGGVRLHKTVSERTALVDEPLVRERVTVERVAVNRPLDDGRIPTVHERDGVLVVPVIEEILIVEKRLMLREELHVRRIREESRERQEVKLEREHVDVERFDAGELPPREH
jgi:uncharacterized protein (TIGR02271 family)